MKIWADHQKTKGESNLKCPLCRETFTTFDMLEQEYRNNNLQARPGGAEKESVHFGMECKSCRSNPISGKCYKCTLCYEFYLCQGCFNTRFHHEHEFLFREKVSQKYRKAIRDHVGVIPRAVATSLAQREITEQDYDLLMQLENSRPEVNLSQIPEKVIKSWPSERVRDNSLLLNPGMQCRVCLRPYKINDQVRKLPACKHKFHLECIDNWLLHSHPTCPIDGTVAWDPLSAEQEKEESNGVKKATPQIKKPSSGVVAAMPNPVNDLSNLIRVNQVPSLNLIVNNKPQTHVNKSRLQVNPSVQAQRNMVLMRGLVKSTMKRATSFDQVRSAPHLVATEPPQASQQPAARINIEGHRPFSFNNNLNLNELTSAVLNIGDSNSTNQQHVYPAFMNILATGNQKLPQIGTSSAKSETKPSTSNKNAALDLSSLIHTKPFQLTRFDDRVGVEASNNRRLESDFYHTLESESSDLEDPAYDRGQNRLYNTIEVGDHEIDQDQFLVRMNTIAFGEDSRSTERLQSTLHAFNKQHMMLMKNRTKIAETLEKRKQELLRQANEAEEIRINAAPVIVKSASSQPPPDT